jgi:hypothetical protein
MMNRCYNPKSRNYPYYGGKDVRLCPAWYRNLRAFSDWAAKTGYAAGLEIDRIDSTGDYSPENYRWVDKATNRRRCHRTEKHALAARRNLAKADHKKAVAASNKVLSKPVVCRETGRKFPSSSAAARFLGVDRSAIWWALQDPNRTCQNTHWKYV